MFTRVRELIATWPETAERLSHGSPTFWGGKKTFCSFHDAPDKYGGRAVWIKATLEAQEGLVEQDPDAFFVPPYVGPSGWIGVRTHDDIDWGLLAQLLEDGYRMVAPKRAIKALDAGRGTE